MYLVIYKNEVVDNAKTEEEIYKIHIEFCKDLNIDICDVMIATTIW